MDVNSINTNINNLNAVPHANLDKASSSKSISSIDKDDALNLSISDIYNKTRDELSHSLQNLNEGIAITNISINSLDKQEKILGKIEDKLNDLKTSDDYNKDRFETAEFIGKQLDNFNDLTENTKYKSKQLLKSSDEEEIINIITNKNNFTINAVDTKYISDKLVSHLQNNDLASENNINNALENTKEAINDITKLKENFNEVESNIKENAKETLFEQIDLSKENFRKKDVDFGKETSDFSKTNITSNSGYLVASQANIVQEQSIKLLS